MRQFLVALCALAGGVLVTSSVGAQQPPPPPAYGPPITLEMAKKAMAAAEAEAAKNNWAMVIAILDSGGNLIMSNRMDNAPIGSIAIARGKARAAVEFKRPTKALEDAIAAGGAGLRLLTIHGSGVFIEGGIPIIVDGKIVGSIGASGATAPQDAQVAQAGVNAAK